MSRLSGQASDARRDAERANARVKDLEDKWAKSKRINQQRKEKCEALERQLQARTSQMLLLNAPPHLLLLLPFFQVEKQASKVPLKSASTRHLEEKVHELEAKLKRANNKGQSGNVMFTNAIKNAKMSGPILD